MKPTLLTPQFSRSSYLLLAVFILATVLSAITYWQFALFTGSMLVFGQGVLHLIVALLLLVIWIKPSLKWQLLTQFLSSFFIFLLCGLLVNESYIRWMEGGPVLTSAALLTTVLGFGALLLLCHLLTRLSDDNQVSVFRRFKSILSIASGTLSLILLVTHLTGWFWLDVAAAFLTAGLMGLVSLFFLLDGYWNIMEVEM